MSSSGNRPVTSRTTIGAETARRALAIVELVADEAGPLELPRLVERSGLSKPTAYRLLRVLAEEGWLERGERSGWRPGGRLRRLARRVGPGADPASLVAPMLAALVAETGETACLHLRTGDLLELAAGSESDQVLRRAARVGERTPLHRGCAGTALLAFAAPEVSDSVLRRLDQPTVTALRRRLEEVRARGWAESVGENHPGVAGIAAAVTAGGGGPVLGSISLAGPDDRFTASARRTASAALIRQAHLASEALADLASPGS